MSSLLDRALAALDEAATRAANAPIAPDKALAFTFAWLQTRMPADKAMVLPELWREMQRPLAGNAALDHGRLQTINNLAGHVRFVLGRG